MAQIVWRFLFGIGSIIVAAIASAQSFPSRPITIVVPFPPGGVSDQATRLVGARLAENLKENVLVDNRPGAGNQIGANFVKQAKPDGHTLFLSNIGSHAINESLYASLSYDPIKDFESVTALIISPTLLVVPAGSAARSPADIIAAAKAKPGGVSYASQSVGSGGHIAGEILKANHGLNLVHVPYKGSVPALTDLIAGRVDLLFDPIVTALPFVRDGKLRALMITSDKRSPLLPDVPTFKEAGLDYPGQGWWGLAAPKGTPAAVVEKANAAFASVFTDPKFAAFLEQQFVVPATTSPAGFAEFLKTDRKAAEDLVKIANTPKQEYKPE